MAKHVTVGGKRRKLVFDYAALCELCDAIGATVSNMQEAIGGMRVGQMYLILWAGLLDEEPSLDSLAVKGWLKAEKNLLDAQAIVATAADAMNDAMTRAAKSEEEGDGGKPSDPPNPAAGDQSPGTTS